MTTISPNPFPNSGKRKLSPAEYIARKKSLACALPKDNKSSCIGNVVKLFYMLLQACLLSFMLTLAACGESTESAKPEDKELEGTSYAGINNTDKNIISIIVNGQGGIAYVDSQNIGGHDCCVFLPRKWHPGIMVTIKWQEDDVYLLDKNGKFVIEDGKKKVVEQPWKTKTVEVAKYEDKDERGVLYIFFYPNDEVKALRSGGVPRRPDYPLPEEFRTK